MSACPAREQLALLPAEQLSGPDAVRVKTDVEGWPPLPENPVRLANRVAASQGGAKTAETRVEH
jgi:hypothetical protein